MIKLTRNETKLFKRLVTLLRLGATPVLTTEDVPPNVRAINQGGTCVKTTTAAIAGLLRLGIVDSLGKHGARITPVGLEAFKRLK